MCGRCSTRQYVSTRMSVSQNLTVVAAKLLPGEEVVKLNNGAFKRIRLDIDRISNFA